jgi:hypothetical protein
MPFPETSRIEVPILQELEATGGGDRLRYVYGRLVSYFPQLTAEDLEARTPSGRCHWHVLVQRAGRALEERGELRRDRSLWVITGRGRERLEEEGLRVPTGELEPVEPPPPPMTHRETQEMIAEIGRLLGRDAELEYDFFDVVWRDRPGAQRLSHVFEVQIAGSVDGALARLKQAFDLQRSRIFLVIADERSASFAAKRLEGPFHEVWEAVQVVTVGELRRLRDALGEQADLVTALTSRG